MAMVLTFLWMLLLLQAPVVAMLPRGPVCSLSKTSGHQTCEVSLISRLRGPVL